VRAVFPHLIAVRRELAEEESCSDRVLLEIVPESLGPHTVPCPIPPDSKLPSPTEGVVELGGVGAIGGHGH
jgi:hypothetical protein